MFQKNVTLAESERLEEDFNERVKYYELVSEMVYNELMEYQWVNEMQEKGIRSYFSDNYIKEGSVEVRTGDESGRFTRIMRQFR